MSFVKRYIDRENSKEHTALQILLEVDALKECELHPGTYLNGSEEVESAYKYAAHEFKKGNYKEHADTQRELTDAIQSVYEEYSPHFECAQCDKLRNE